MSGYQSLFPGMGYAVAKRTVLRKDENGKWETWQDVAKRVAKGNSLLAPKESQSAEYKQLNKHIAKATIIMSGRHLQHGDKTQPDRHMEIFSNCASASTSFAEFLLLLCGSGVGRCYDDDMMLVNWDYAPTIRCVLDHKHPDFDPVLHESVRDAKHKYGSGRGVVWFQIPDTREGWAKGLEIWETMAFERMNKDKTLVLDFSLLRESGVPIKGMQNRPASGPVPLMNAYYKASTVCNAGLEPWMQTLYIDHYFAEAVLVGGARRAARLACKYWKDPSVLQFINIKRPIEFAGLKPNDVLEYRENNPSPGNFLWSANNSITVDQEFWELLLLKPSVRKYKSAAAKWARKVFKAAVQCGYVDGTGEPGFLNVDRFVRNDDGWGDLYRGDFVGSKRYQIEDESHILYAKLAKRAKNKKYNMIANPCTEIQFSLLGAFCIIGNLAPFHADTLDEVLDSARVLTRALIRVNLMDSIYKKEVDRTNRIGVGLTGVHEFAWKFFRYGFRDLVDEEKSKNFWLFINKINQTVEDEANSYSKELGLVSPHTMRMVAPNGTVSKLFGLTEGWHLPPMAQYLRWVQFSNNDPLVKAYADNGYPTKQLKSYRNTTIVGFPTRPQIGQLKMGDKLVTAPQATIGEQYQWLKLGEKYWICGVDENGTPKPDRGNSISYTLKWDPKTVTYKHFRSEILDHQSEVKACAIMPAEDVSSYEYQPESPVSEEKYDQIVANIVVAEEDISREHIDCATGGCPVDFKEDTNQ